MIDDLDVLNDLDQLRSRYDIVGRLGNDGTFAVYRGQGRGSDRELAIKVMSNPRAPRATPRARFGWQAHSTMQLRHPNLVALHAVHHLQGGALALAMEPPGGPTLAEVIREEGPLPVARAEQVLRDVAAALSFLHASGVVHRGVRPQSIYLDEAGGRARLAHFGIETAPRGRDDAAERAATIGAFAYLAPEQIDGHAQVDGRTLSEQSDLYSLGLVGYAMLTGTQPWEGSTLDGMLERRRSEPLPSLSTLRPDTPAQLCRAVEGSLDRNPRHRWSSAEEFVAQMDGCAETTRAAAIDWPGLLAGARGRAAALGTALGTALAGSEIATKRGRLALGVAGAVAGVAALGLLQDGSPPTAVPVAQNWMPAVTATPPGAPVERARPDRPAPTVAAAPRAAAPPERLVAGDPPRGPAAPAPRAVRTAAASSPPRAAPRAPAPPLRAPVPLLGDPVASDVPVLLGAPIP